MSRIGKKPINVPAGVRVTIDPQSRVVTVQGPRGELAMTHRPEVAVTWDEGENRIICSIGQDQMKVGQMKAYWGLTRALIANLIVGVTDGYSKRLVINGVGWNAKPMGETLQLNVGYCHPLDLPVPDGVKVEVERNSITVAGPDKQVVGQFAAEIRAARPPEPYNGKGIKYADEVIIRKQGKVFGA
ncbi:MAG: 50S ribosomal protein L6 [Planctomycetota bacterium]|nr:50S ribosomal protein L6 [Planctomycetota bacterium]